MLSLMAAVLTCAGIYELLPDSPERMRGRVNIAIVPFGAAQKSGDDAQPTADAISESAFRSIVEHLQPQSSLLGIEVRSPDEVDSLEIGEREATDLEREIGADVVVFAQITETDVLTKLEPSVHLARSILPGAEELAGFHRFGGPIVTRAPASNAVTGGRLADSVARRARALARLVLGLSYYQERSYRRAYKALLAASRDRTWSSKRPEIVHLALANAAIKQDRYALSARHARDALTLRPTLRARFVLAEAEFLGDRRRCEPRHIDKAAVRRAIKRYRAIARSTAGVADETHAVLHAKAQFGTGRALYCLGRALGEDVHSDARRAYDRVVASHEAGVPGIAEQAAEAHAGLALLLLEKNESARLARLARQEYEAAIKLSGADEAPRERRSRQAVFRSNLARVLVRLGNLRQARRELRLAADLELDSARRQVYLTELRELH